MTSKRIVPKKLREIDLAKYGGEGTLTIRPKTSLIESKIISHMAGLAREMGVELTSDNREELETLLGHDITILLMKLCIVVPEGEPEITEEELLDYPDELLVEISEIITESAEFPLEQSPGEEVKKE